MSSEEILSSTNETESGEVDNNTSSEEISEIPEENNIIEEEVSEIPEENSTVEEEISEMSDNDSEILNAGYDVTETSTETTQEVIYQVADLSRIEGMLQILTCLSLFFVVYFLGSMVYKLVKDIFY